MRLCEIEPIMRHLFYFTYRQGVCEYKKISFEKTQYTYRFLFVDKGALDVTIDGKTERIGAGDLLFLTPGDRYRLLPIDSDFSIYNLFFEIIKDNEAPKGAPSVCIFMPEYNEELCSSAANVSDLTLLNRPCILRGLELRRTFERLHRMNKQSPFGDFYKTSLLRSILAEIALSVCDEKNHGRNTADEIIAYVYSNYDKDISASGVSEHFFYHPNYVNKLIKNKTGKTLSELIRHVKIEHAVALLTEVGTAPNKIFHALGFYDYSHFYKAFIRETGMSPSEYKKTVT